MKRFLTRRPAARLRPACLNLEGLEDRQLLSTANGGRWTYANRITYSFVPDGTNIGGIPSNLFGSLNAVAPTATWQLQFQKAAATWSAVANINLTLVGDDGSPVGGDGYQQGDTRFGDIRIGAIPQNLGTLAFAMAPPPINGSSNAGDIVLNSSIAWKINNDYDLQTVAIHEIGHALGMGHSAISSAVMYSYYTSMKQGLTSDDIAGIQALYGTPTDLTANATAAAAIDLTPMVDGQSQLTLNGQYITSATSLEWYKVTVPASTNGTMTVVMQSSGLSSLSPRLAVFNASLGTIGQSVLPNSYGSTATFTVSGVTPGQVYYVRASSGNTGASAIGAFAIQVNMGSTPLPTVAPPNTMVVSQPDQGVGPFYQTADPDLDGDKGQCKAKDRDNEKGKEKNRDNDKSKEKDRDKKKNEQDDDHHRIQIGNLTGWGDELWIGDLSPRLGGNAGGEGGAPDVQDLWTHVRTLYQETGGHTVNLARASASAVWLQAFDDVLAEWNRERS